jgi:hypothetical protein
MKRFPIVFLALLAFGASAAFAQNVSYNFEKSADFSKFKTYKWVDIKNADHVDELTASQIKAALDTELTAKGLTKTESDDADLYIGYQTAIGSEKEFNSYNTGWGWRGGMGTTTTTTNTIYIGELVLDMYEVSKKSVVWRGTATKTLDMKAKPEKRQNNITKAVTKLLKNFPPPVKK